MRGESDITIILDRSGSMESIASEGRPIAEAPRLTVDMFQPRGSTALLDAIDRSLILERDLS